MGGAIPLHDVIYAFRMVQPMQTPDAKQGEIGIVNYHGEEILLFSIRSLFGLTDRPFRITDNIIIVRTKPCNVALWVDGTSSMHITSHERYQPGTNGSDECLIPGTHRTREGYLIISQISEVLQYIRTHPAPHTDDKGVTLSEIPLQKPSAEPDFYPINNIDIILKKRADELAQPEMVPLEVPLRKVLKFSLAYREFALETEYIREVVTVNAIIPVPRTPNYIVGICEIRGEIVSLVDLRVLISIQNNALTNFNQVIVLTDRKITFGILVDQITGIRTIREDKISHSSSMEFTGNNQYIYGTMKDALIILNGAAILSDPNMIINDNKARTYSKGGTER